MKAVSFGDDFDNLMQKMNYNETNGICIGPELSRIFAEIILQSVDLDIQERASLEGLQIGRDFQCKRYVDDYILFSKDEDTQEKMYELIEVSLKEYNLHLNSAKYLKYSRPFVTPKSRVIQATKLVIGDFLETKLTDKENSLIVPNRIFRASAFTKSFLNALKSICAEQAIGYDAISDYVISSIAQRIIRLTTDYDLIRQEERRDEEIYKTAFRILLDALFFMYSVNPTVSSSYHLGRALIITVRFVREKLPGSYPSIASQVHLLVSHFIRQCVNLEKATSQSKVPVEILNVLLASRELGEPYLLDEEWLRNNVFDIKSMEYFSIVSCLYYIRNDRKYVRLKAAIEAVIVNKLNNCVDVLNRAHDAHLSVDILTCPYISQATRISIYQALRSALNLSSVSSSLLATHLTEFAQRPWFVQWDTVDILNLLKKKELSAVY